MKSAVRVWIGAGLLMLLPALVAAALHITQNIADPTESGQETTQIVVEVTTVTYQPRSVVSYRAEYRPGRLIRSATSGLLTSIPSTGETLVSGEVVAKIDNQFLVGYQADEPFWRNLSGGDSGTDVTQLQNLLSDWGYFLGEIDGRYGDSTAEAVAEFNKDHNPGSKSRVFSQGGVVWLGTETFTIDAVLKAVGEQVSPGDGLFQASQTLDAIVIDETAESQSALAGQTEVEFQLGEIAVPYKQGQTRIIDPDLVATLAPALSPTGDGVGYLVSLDVQQRMSVPATSLVVDEAGNKCVLEAESLQPIAVNPLGGGLSSVTFAPIIGLDKVIANPNQAVPRLTCN